ncbi:MAG: hypothetical protein R3E77_00575 [Steroidobacteraceae bacterium]
MNTRTVKTLRAPLAGTSLVLAYAMLLSNPTTVVADGRHQDQPGVLVEKVRQATAGYRDINYATQQEGWVQATPCVSGPDRGAMGVHLVQPARLGDGAVNANEPEALIYEPQPDGRMRLVGVEYIVFADAWAAAHPDGSTPSVDGHLMHLIGAPNRYGLPAFYELHVWAWRGNPLGSFANYNTRVTCDHQG